MPSAAMPASLSAKSGDTTVRPPITSAGTRRHNDLPEPVGITVSTLRPPEQRFDDRLLPRAEPLEPDH